jgi:hypothetical protein
VSVYPGDDGVMRVVTLKTSHGYLKRLVAKLAVVVLNYGKFIGSNTEPIRGGECLREDEWNMYYVFKKTLSNLCVLR